LPAFIEEMRYSQILHESSLARQQTVRCCWVRDRHQDRAAGGGFTALLVFGSGWRSISQTTHDAAASPEPRFRGESVLAASTLERPMRPSVPHHRRKDGDMSTGRRHMQSTVARSQSVSRCFMVNCVRTIRIVALSIAMQMLPRLALAQTSPWE